MKFEIWNFGTTIDIPTSKGIVALKRKSSLITEDKELADTATKYPRVEVKKLDTEDTLKNKVSKQLSKIIGR